MGPRRTQGARRGTKNLHARAHRHGKSSDYSLLWPRSIRLWTPTPAPHSLTPARVLTSAHLLTPPYTQVSQISCPLLVHLLCLCTLQSSSDFFPSTRETYCLSLLGVSCMYVHVHCVYLCGGVSRRVTLTTMYLRLCV